MATDTPKLTFVEETRWGVTPSLGAATPKTFVTHVWTPTWIGACVDERCIHCDARRSTIYESGLEVVSPPDWLYCEPRKATTNV